MNEYPSPSKIKAMAYLRFLRKYLASISGKKLNTSKQKIVKEKKNGKKKRSVNDFTWLALVRNTSIYSTMSRTLKENCGTFDYGTQPCILIKWLL